MATILQNGVPIRVGGVPYQAESGLGNIFSTFAMPFLNGTQTELRREQMHALRDKNLSNEETRQVLLSPEAVAGRVDPNRLYAAGVGTGRRADDLSGFISGVAANRLGADAPETTNALTGEGKYNATPTYQRRDLANRTGIAAMQERTKRDLAAANPETVLAPNEQGVMVPTVVRRAESYGRPASVPLTQQQGAFAARHAQTPEQVEALPPAAQNFISAQPSQPRPAMNWIARDPDGNVSQGRTFDQRTDAGSGQPLPPNAQLVSPSNAGGSAVMAPLAPDATDLRRLRQQLTANEEVRDVSDRIIKMVQANPTIVGPTGNVRRMGQNVVDTLNNIDLMFGGEGKFVASVQQVQQDMLSRGVDQRLLPGLFDPSADHVITLNSLLTYKAAAALAGQQGREVSNQDIQRIKTMFGDPTTWSQGPQAYTNKLQLIRELAEKNRAQAETVIRRGNVTARPPGEPAVPSTEEVWEPGPDGRPRRVR